MLAPKGEKRSSIRMGIPPSAIRTPIKSTNPKTFRKLRGFLFSLGFYGKGIYFTTFADYTLSYMVTKSVSIFFLFLIYSFT